MCRIGRALGFGQVNFADKAVINLNILPAGAVLVIAALMHDDFLNHFPQEGGGQFFKSKVLSHNPHEFLGVDGGGLRLGKFLLQSAYGWYTGIYTDNRGDKSNDIKLSDWSGPFDVYIRYVQTGDWGKELGFAIVKAGAPYPEY